MPISNYLPSSRLIAPGVCTSTTRPASPFEGQVIYETNTKQTLVYNGSAWVMLTDADTPPGLQYIKSYTLNSWFVQCTSAFTSEFTNYRLSFSYTSSSANAVYIRWLVGTTVQTGNILSQAISTQLSAGTVVAGSRGDQYGLLASGYPTYPTTYFADVFNPQGVGYTSYNISSAVLGVSATDSIISLMGGRNIATTQIDGFEITTANGSASLSGVIHVYGYRTSI